MNNYIKIKTGLFLFVLIGLISIGYAHDEKPEIKCFEYEKLWMEKGPKNKLKEIVNKNQFGEKQIKAFLFFHSKDFSSDKQYFFNWIHSPTKPSINAAETWLKERADLYEKRTEVFILNIEEEVERFSSLSSLYSPPPPLVVTGTNDCINFDFSNSSPDEFEEWVAYEGVASDLGEIGHGFITPVTPSTSHIELITSQGNDPIIGEKLQQLCEGCDQVVRLENTTWGGDAARLQRTFIVDEEMPYFKFWFAVVLQDPGNEHPDESKPYFDYGLYDSNGDTIQCTYYKVIANAENPTFQGSFIQKQVGSSIYYKKWEQVIIPLSRYIGEEVTVKFTASDCSWGGHYGYAYVYCGCEGPSISMSECNSGSQTITISSGFDNYWWKGPGIVDKNFGRSIEVDEEGEYTVIMTTVSGCMDTLSQLSDNCTSAPTLCAITDISITPGSCNSNNNFHSISGTVTLSNAYSKGMLVVQAGGYTFIKYAPFSTVENFEIDNIWSMGGNIEVKASLYESIFSMLSSKTCTYSNTYEAPSFCGSVSIPCESCIESFRPTPDKTYIVSGWVKEIGAGPTVKTYEDGYIKINFDGTGTYTAIKCYPTGKIIEGWQRIYFEFTIPSDADKIIISLETDGADMLFDDIRVHPTDGSMVAYVYDPLTLRLVAVLDENNYATLYEYDQEGRLIRVKKETERGIMTIKESRNSTIKAD
ncbi:MAG: hypothetical protein M0R38_09715 [Bacteroidia bacterium]|nr:hypothetical protein [Bacteroidia bacterium]